MESSPEEKWIRDLTQDGDVEPNPGPQGACAENQHCFTWNAGGGKGAWSALDLLAEAACSLKGPDIGQRRPPEGPAPCGFRHRRLLCQPHLPLDATRHASPRMALTHLYRMVSGHAWDLRFQATNAIMSVLHRLVSRHNVLLTPWRRPASGWTGALRKGLRDLGWREDSPWQWSHVGTGKILGLLKRQNGWMESVETLRHELRESWRHGLFQAWLDKGRIDSIACAGLTYNAARARPLRYQELTAHELAVVTGAAVSPASADALHKPCPWCGLAAQQADWRHCTWVCERAPRPEGLTEASCVDALQSRLGWPTRPERKRMDHDILVRSRCLSDRYT